MPSELLSEVENKVKDRLTELRPLHDEYLELSEFAERMGITAAASAAASAAAAAAAAATAKPKPRKKAAAKPAKRAASTNGNGRTAPDRRADLIRMVTENPGITVREVGEKLGIDGTQFYRHRNNLVEEGVIEARGPNLFPKGTATAPAGEGGGGGEGDGAGA